MSEPATPRYQWGQRVQAVTDLFNDGSYPSVEPGALLVKAGERGEVVQVGTHVESDSPVYLVEFGTEGAGNLRVVGCGEEEIAPFVDAERR